MIKMHNRDCMELMKEYPDGYFELAIVDPEYGINASKGTWGSTNKGRVRNYGKKEWDRARPNPKYFEELQRVSKSQIIFGGNYFADLLPPSSCWVVWDKDNSGDFADCELAWTNFETAVRKFKYRWNGMLQQDMANKEKRIHPTQKPAALYKWLLTNYAKPGDKILDTHGGSGSICIACHDLGFDLTWTELDPDYYAAAVKRYQQRAAQLQMFQV